MFRLDLSILFKLRMKQEASVNIIYLGRLQTLLIINDTYVPTIVHHQPQFSLPVFPTAIVTTENKPKQNKGKWKKSYFFR